MGDLNPLLLLVLILEKCDTGFAVWYVYTGTVVWSTANKD